MIFERYNATDLFLVGSSSPGDAGYVAFYLIAGDAGQTLTIGQTWNTVAGYYLFLRHEPTDLAAFAAALSGFFASATPQHTGWAWLVFTPGEQPALAGTVVDAVENSGAVVLAATTDLRLYNYAAPLMQGTPVQAVAADLDNITGFQFAYPPIAGSPPPNFAGDIHLPLVGAHRGCLLGEVTIGDFSNNASSGWNIGIYYFVQGASSIVSQYYPVFTPEAGLQVMFRMSLDPVDQLNPDRTYLQFTDVSFLLVQDPANPMQFSIEQAAMPGALMSAFRTIYGDRIALVPVTSTAGGGRPAKLVLQPLPSNGGEQEYYFTPDGDFCLAVLPGTSGSGSEREQHDLMPGLSGLESIGFRPHTAATEGNVLSFFAGNAAYVPVFPLLGASTAGAQPLLTSEYVTAWMSVGAPIALETPPDSVLYFAQPDGAPLYGDSGTAANADSSADILSYFPAAAALLPMPSRSACFPAAPIAAAMAATGEFGAGFIRNLELQVLSPFRQTAIRQFSAGQASAFKEAGRGSAEKYGTTPQGLLVKTEGFQWKELLLASNTDSAQGGAAQSLSFTDLNSVLQAAFQTNQQFLVITWDKYLKEDGTLFQDTISIEGWPFFLNVGLSQPGDYRNVLIFKFGEGTVADRVRDVRLWTDPEHFNQTENDNLQTLSDWLTVYIEDAKERAREDSAFASFAALVDNPAWNGILALNATIGISDFPPELKGLLAGIDLNRFSAHHFGIDVNFVQPDGSGGLQMAPQSSMFGLIDYIDESLVDPRAIYTQEHGDNGSDVELPDPDFPPYYDHPYQFVVLALQVVFANSEIKNFTSTIKLTVNQLFGEAVLNPDNSTGPGVNAMILDGIYEDHSGSKAYVFNIRESVRYSLIGKIVDYVEITKAQFSTLQSVPVPGSETGDEIVQSRFSFWGTMSFFNVAEDFDIFSFNRLSYAGMNVDMSFALSDSANPEFAFNPGETTFDMAGSEARNDSVFKNFPLQLQGIAYNGNSTGRPQDMGFMAVKTPLAGYQTTIDNTWNALAFTINLGTPGALAEAVGFTAQLFVAWSPVYAPANTNPINISLKLPRGGGNKNQISLQGVLQLTIRTIKFNTTVDDDGNRAFLLLLERIALRVLGIGLPMHATLDAVLFGNPDPGAATDSLGWYFAYNKTGALAKTDGQQLFINDEVE